VTKSKRLTNDQGIVVSTVELDPWGADTNRSNNAAFQPHKYTTYERDGNGSDEAMFRRHNRWHSRFDQPDPYDGSYDLTSPQSFNRYAYTQNDPVNFVDPSGLMQTICGYIANANNDGGHWACVELWDWYRWGGLESGGGKGTGTKPQNPGQDPFKGVTAGIGNNNCPPDKQRFFTWLSEPLGKMAQDLNTTKTLMLTEAAKEGGWTTKNLDHNQPLNNPFGVNKISKGQAAGNVAYASLDDAIQYWGGRFGDRVRGAQTADDFLKGLQHPSTGQPYNTQDPKYEDKFRAINNSMLKFMKLCGIQ
jgi:RHS repeat-associated protein